jgi:hypothetical protein
VLPSKRRRTPPAAPSCTHGAESASPPWPVGWSRGCFSYQASVCAVTPETLAPDELRASAGRDWSCRAPASLTRQQRRAECPYSMQLGHAGRRLGLPRRARAFVDASERRRVSASDARSGRAGSAGSDTRVTPALARRSGSTECGERDAWTSSPASAHRRGFETVAPARRRVPATSGWPPDRDVVPDDGGAVGSLCAGRRPA